MRLRILSILNIYTLYSFLLIKSPKNYVLVEKSLYILTGRKFIKMYHCGWRLCTALLPLHSALAPMTICKVSVTKLWLCAIFWSVAYKSWDHLKFFWRTGFLCVEPFTMQCSCSVWLVERTESWWFRKNIFNFYSFRLRR